MGILLTLGAASRQLGVSKTTLRRAIDAGELIAGRKDNWVFQIDSSELARYGLSRQVNAMQAIVGAGATERQPQRAGQNSPRRDTFRTSVVGTLKRFGRRWSEPAKWRVWT